MTSPDPTPPTPRRLVRPSDDRMIAGVASGLGRHFDLDPLLFRIGFAVLTLFGGSGLVLYLLLALLVPSDDPDAEPRRTRTVLLIGLVIVLLIALPIAIPAAFFLSPVIVVIALGLLLYRAAGGNIDPRAVRASVIVLAVVGAALLGAGAAVAVAFGAGTAMSAIVLGLGVALTIGAFAGGARWLIVPALVLAVPVAIVSAADIDLHGGVGQRDYRPASVADMRSVYKLGVGDLQLDLRDVDFPTGTTDLKTDLGIGETVVMLPDDVCLDSDVHVGMGSARVLGRQNDGIDVDASRREDAPALAPVVRINAEAGVGQVSIWRGDHFVSGSDHEDCARG